MATVRLQLIPAVVALGLALAGGVVAAAECEAPRIAQGRINAVVKAVGAESYQMDPSAWVARLTFSAPDAPPLVETIYAGGDSRFADRLIAEARLLRSPCATAAAPLTSREFRYVGVRYGGFERYRAAEPRLKRELQLTELVRLIKDLKSQRVKFDLREMGCPFKLRFAPFQPYLPNEVEEQVQGEPSRAPLLEWLRTITVDIPKDMMPTAIGRESMIAVPCAVLDLS